MHLSHLSVNLYIHLCYAHYILLTVDDILLYTFQLGSEIFNHDTKYDIYQHLMLNKRNIFNSQINSSQPVPSVLAAEGTNHQQLPHWCKYTLPSPERLMVHHPATWYLQYSVYSDNHCID